MVALFSILVFSAITPPPPEKVSPLLKLEVTTTPVVSVELDKLSVANLTLLTPAFAALILVALFAALLVANPSHHSVFQQA